MTTTGHALRLFPAAAGFCALALMLANPAAATPDSTARLKEAGHYDSLMQAVQAARYSVEPLPDGASADGGCYAGNPAQSLRCWFRPDGLELQSAGTMASAWKMNLRLRGYGRETLQAANVDGVSARQNRVELSRADGAVVEWYENKAAGLEQGFTVRSVPAGGAGPLRLLLDVEGDLRPELEVVGTDSTRSPSASSAEMRRSSETPLRQQASAVKFVTADGQATLRYSGLKVWDATQRELAAHIEVQGRRLALVVNDQDAAYPVTIDPLITSQEAQLTTGDGAASDWFGNSLSLSGDGNTAVVGAQQDDTTAGADAGSACVFVRSGTTWSQQAKLTAGDAEAGDEFGVSVNVSSDGNTALVGAYGNDTAAGPDAGSAYVFVRSGSTWSQQARLTASDGFQGDLFGISVSASSDGNTALVGNIYDTTPAGSAAGSAYVFVRSGTTWSEQAKLTAGDGAAGDNLGCSVSVSGDGNTALVGAYQDDTAAGVGAGSAYVFVRSGTTWSQQAKLTASDGAADDLMGRFVSVSADGNTALVGALSDDTAAGSDAGSAYVFVRSGTTWSQQAKLTAGDGAAGDNFGSSVSVSGDGNMALVGAWLASNNGAAYAFLRSGTTWNQKTKLTASDGAAGDRFGSAAALSSDGTTALVGARSDDTTAGTDAGSAYVFKLTRTPEISVQQPSGTDLADGGSKDFGSVHVNANLSLTFTITNSGDADLTGLGISIDGSDAAQFTVTASPTAPVSVGGSTTFTVRFAPTSGGAKTAALHLANNDTDENPYDLTLTGTGLNFDASDATYARAPGLALKIRIADIVWDVNASPVTVQSLGASAQGATLSYDSTYIYYRPANNNNDSFTYTASNGSETDSGTITVNVATSPGGLAKTIEVSGGSATVKFFGIPGIQYDVQRTTSLTEPVTWTTLTGTALVPGADGSFSFTDSSAPNGTAYYRSVQH